MNTYRIAFIGHRKIEGHNDLEDKIEELARDAMRNNDFVEFLMGRNGDFDISAASAVRRARKAFGEESSALILVQPYSMKDDEYYEHYYDSILYPIDKKTHYKKAITKRNEWLVDHADLLVAFVENEKAGGAYTALKYAEKQGVENINLGEDLSKYDITKYEIAKYEDSDDVLFEPDDRYINEAEKQYEARKFNALLYLQAHRNEVKENEEYGRAYIRILNEYIRQLEFYDKEHRVLTQVSQEERDEMQWGLDVEVEIR